jgi:hypothetical protein
MNRNTINLKGNSFLQAKLSVLACNFTRFYSPSRLIIGLSLKYFSSPHRLHHHPRWLADLLLPSFSPPCTSLLANTLSIAARAIWRLRPGSLTDSADILTHRLAQWRLIHNLVSSSSPLYLSCFSSRTNFSPASHPFYIHLYIHILLGTLSLRYIYLRVRSVYYYIIY